MRTITDTKDAISFFGVSSGQLGTYDVVHTPYIQNAGNGWWKCSIKFTMPATNVLSRVIYHIASDNAVNNYAGDITKGIGLWGAQVYKN